VLVFRVVCIIQIVKICQRRDIFNFKPTFFVQIVLYEIVFDSNVLKQDIGFLKQLNFVEKKYSESEFQTNTKTTRFQKISEKPAEPQLQL
jgi:hypothetical protein